MKRIAIVGAGLAGLSAGRELRRLGFEGELTVVGDEPHGPYRRPPLSKAFLAGRGEVDLRGRDELDATWLLGQAATGLDLASRRVLRGPSRAVDFDGLVIATGMRARTLPGAFTLRGIDDARRLRTALAAGPAVVVAGAGFIGCEIASTVRSMGLPVTLVAPDPVPLHRPLGAAVGAIAAELLRARGVDLRLGRRVTGVRGTDRVERVHLDDGATIPADLVVAAAGAVPQTEWLRGSGLRARDGVAVGGDGLAAPGVAAAGDVAARPHPLFPGRRLRIEHYANAAEQGARAARALLDPGQVPALVPSFWSDLDGVRLQSIGFTGAEYEVRLVEREPDHRFVAEYRHAGRLVGAAVAGFAGALPRYRRLIIQEVS
ncbi:NAD(P)/FAD-dependent oxidoreductase [Glycomyces tarimensis]